ncbi:MAG: hypothetical protein WBO39_08000 [Ferruginibacter sp.]
MIKTLPVIVLLFSQFNNFSHQSSTGFSAAYNSRNNAVLIKWQNSTPGIKSFSVQKSVDNKTWDDIAEQVNNQQTATASFYFEEKQPSTGQNYYRLKSNAFNGNIVYSLAVQVVITSPENGWVMYPVPVKDLLTIDYRGTEKIPGVINVFIQQSSGRIITKLRLSSLNRLIRIPVDHLGKGMYDIRIIVEGNVVWNERFVK